MINIKEYPDYAIDLNGNIYSIKYNKKRLLKPNIGKDGYQRIKLYKCNKNKTFLIHRIVADSYLSNDSNKPQVNHINGIKTDNRVENLEWCTASENVIHSYRKGLQSKKGLNGENNGQSKLDSFKVLEIFKSELDINKLSDIYNVSFATIYDIKKQRTWKHLTSNI
jgi:hypothetical protein